MFAPVIGVDGKILYVAPEKILYIEPGPDLEEKGPDGNPWPTSYINLSDELALHVKGTAPMILQSWFGPSVQERQEKPDLILPAHMLRRPQ